jgi:conjugal transfer pilus assembly protein TraW
MRAAVLIGLCAATAAVPAVARDYGQAGNVWPVAEPDLLAVIKARLDRLQATGEIDRLNETLKRHTIARVNRPVPVAGLVAATSPRSWTIDPTISVSADIADAKGHVIWPQGTRINPLDTVALRQPLVFLDGDNAAQLVWATAAYKPEAAKLILTNGAPLELMKARQRRFYFDQGGKLVAHFGVRALPAIVDQQGRSLRVREIVLPDKETVR